MPSVEMEMVYCVASRSENWGEGLRSRLHSIRSIDSIPGSSTSTQPVPGVFEIQEWSLP